MDLFVCRIRHLVFGTWATHLTSRLHVSHTKTLVDHLRRLIHLLKGFAHSLYWPTTSFYNKLIFLKKYVGDNNDLELESSFKYE